METITCGPLLSTTLNDSEIDQLTQTLKALADPVRLKLVNLIATGGEACACDFPAAVNKDQSTVSHHLKVLTLAGVVERQQRGKWAWYQVNNDLLAQTCAVLC
ncbi:MAG: helix-turn-helix transcriptional regulator [Actinobacteria bacterium]|jgi:ArsR family transcriptional regulator|nr:helix-turn-helix transcriptional regulator [Actinomycetota bacterium]MBT3746747.1 helix-turn-helix transcriptional regulator [Actinomycetota bacterium]MBT3968722.1 helix-turn-helix transcriptional regulator [Actinomycetota bacterium]MBT4010100.1 helix-turn-helix transcriptional regulator [Actinomycetota bacterium]MBT4303459.1 helix-turn-helix transcriptional regulator [Actinomycetota bacterium]